MATYHETGTLSWKGQVRTWPSKDGRTWANQDIVIDIPGWQGSFSRLALQVSTDLIDTVEDIALGVKVEVAFRIFAREYNGKFYNTVSLHDIKPVEDSQKPVIRATETPQPVQQTLTPSAMNDSLNPDEAPEDLPF